jgi:hypothetical protein
VPNYCVGAISDLSILSRSWAAAQQHKHKYGGDNRIDLAVIGSWDTKNKQLLTIDGKLPNSFLRASALDMLGS